jgi:uncharacterized protein
MQATTRRAGSSLLWRRLDRAGHEAACLLPVQQGWLLAGSAVFTNNGSPAQLQYEVICDARWRTLSAAVTGWVGEERVEVGLEAGERHAWSMNGQPCPAVSGCSDIDLNFSPSTNLLPIRRLDLPIGGEAEVRAAWLRFPELTLEPLVQRYRRTGRTSYRYESDGGRFFRELRVNEIGFVTEYPGFWVAESPPRAAV